MNSPSTVDWWALHLRRARGEKLAEAEERAYLAELDRLDKEESPPKIDLAALKELRAKVRISAEDNVELRKRSADLQRQIETIERSLSQETRQALGVGD